MGDAVTWGEAKLLIEEACSDPSTALGAELAGWAYPASTLDLLSLITGANNPKATKQLMPWTMKRPGEAATSDEVATAAADLEAGIVFT